MFNTIIQININNFQSILNIPFPFCITSINKLLLPVFIVPNIINLTLPIKHCIDQNNVSRQNNSIYKTLRIATRNILVGLLFAPYVQKHKNKIIII